MKILGEKIVKLKTRSYKIQAAYFPEYKKNCWTTFKIDPFTGREERMNLMTRGECRNFPKKLGLEAQKFLAGFKT